MARFPWLVIVVTLGWFQRRQQTNILWSSSGMNCLSLLHYFLPGVSPAWMYGNMYISWWMYFSSRSFSVGKYVSLCWRCWGVWFLVNWRVLCRRLHIWCICRSFVLVYQCGFCYINGSCRCGIGSRLSVLTLHIPHGLTYDQVFHPIINGEKKVGGPHFFALILSNVSTIY